MFCVTSQDFAVGWISFRSFKNYRFIKELFCSLPISPCESKSIIGKIMSECWIHYESYIHWCSSRFHIWHVVLSENLFYIQRLVNKVHTFLTPVTWNNFSLFFLFWSALRWLWLLFWYTLLKITNKDFKRIHNYKKNHEIFCYSARL